jgi:hypothetical protein
MANTFELIASATVGSGGQADITFNTIQANWTDLCIKVSGRTNFATNSVAYAAITQINGSSSGLSVRYLLGDGSGTPASGTDSTNGVYGAISTNGNTASTFGSCEFYIPNYAGSTQKSISVDAVSENNATFAEAWLGAGLWTGTSAITSIKLTPLQGTLFQQYTTAYIYGVKNA